MTSEWIAVSEKEPPQFEYVLTWAPWVASATKYSVARMVSERDGGRTWWEGIYQSQPTHWQPLPAPPKGEENE